MQTSSAYAAPSARPQGGALLARVHRGRCIGGGRSGDVHGKQERCEGGRETQSEEVRMKRCASNGMGGRVHTGRSCGVAMVELSLSISFNPNGE